MTYLLFKFPYKYYHLPLSICILYSSVLCLLLVIISIKDLKLMLISRRACLIGLLIGISLALINIFYIEDSLALNLLFNNVIASFTSLIALLSLKYFSHLIIKKKMLGAGDAKLAAMGGAWLGLQGIYSALLIAFLAGGIYSVLHLILKNYSPYKPIPFAPFISGGILIVWFFGPNSWWEKLQGLF